MLLLDEPEAELVAGFHEGRLGDAALARDPVLSRWRRARAAGLDADGAAYAVGTTGAELAERRERLDHVFREERALFEPIARDFARRDLVALVADADGVIVSARGGGAFSDDATRVRLVEGAIWSEATRGTNAIGTALVEERSVAVVGRAHYERRNGGLFCYATPVRSAFGDLACVLDVTGPMSRHDAAIGVAVRAAGQALELALRARAFASSSVGGLGTLERLVARCASPALLVEASGHVRLVNDLARTALRTGEGVEGLACERVFGASFAELASVARQGGKVRFETAWAEFQVELDPIHGPGERLLALLVYLAPRRAPSRPPAPVVEPSRAPSPVAPRSPVSRVAHPAFDAILGDDAALERARGLAARFAPTALPVLLLAETGTGKELFARAIHAASPRAARPFVALNCGALSRDLLETELFGYAPGAFTGAGPRGADGKIAASDGGTLFLDEVAEMPDALQAALLRVLDDGAYFRVGEVRPRRADFRLVCATCRDLPAMVEAGTFRRDLFFRIQGATVVLPPLRDRTDKLALATGLLAALAGPSTAPGLAEDGAAWIDAYAWPGNVRELKSALAHAVALADRGPLGRAHFPEPHLAARPPSSPPPAQGPSPDALGGFRTRDAIFRDAVAETVRACRGNLSEAARRLGVARSTLYRALGRQG